MKKSILLSIAILLLCSCSRISRTPYRPDQFDSTLIKVRVMARKILPDTLISFYPLLNKEEDKIVFHSVDENLFTNLQKINKKDLNTLPWIYSELILVKDKQEYDRLIDCYKQEGTVDLNVFDAVYTYDQLWKQYWGIEPCPSEDLYIYVPDVIMTSDTTSTILFRSGYGMIVEKPALYEPIPKSIIHGYSSGVTYSDSECKINYWTIIW